MKTFRLRFLMWSTLLTMAASTVHGQLEPSCEKESPERRGDLGCSLVDNKPLVKLPTLPPAKGYSMLAMSAYVPAGLTSRIHTHSGVEGSYVVDGQQCLETPTRIYRMAKGGTLVIPAGVTMRLVATGTKPRRALALIVYDSSQPPTTRIEMEPLPKLANCKR
jgi:quercetin dioxygenase-like cupin family protein